MVNAPPSENPVPPTQVVGGDVVAKRVDPVKSTVWFNPQKRIWENPQTRTLTPKYDRKQEYREYLKSDHWKNLRGAKLKLNGRCERCGSKKCLQVHHKAYRRDWHDTELFELETLCILCHKREHGLPVRKLKRRLHRRAFRAKVKSKAQRQLRDSRRRRYDWSF